MDQTDSVIHFNIQASDQLTWNVEPLLHEVKHALERLATEDETSVIDLRSIPLAPGEEDRILEILGLGEVVARLNVLGSSDVVETEYSGVWVVTHYNENEETIGRFIEVTRMPEILRSQAEDVAEASERLALRLEDEQQEKQTSNKLAVEK
ncbi:hydrogenase expression/formation C-terminal domain-containing protein [Solemya velum gill symbiont]|uniref:HupH hydrogenase expression protein n=1 Tax=Solemya velum gill symbiont TaxID=2340 RepID=A0A0B0H9U2_SOVGS|nr:hydrogenase expression/formation C-terminal domain-containing protein [Solemya velum gill symbiont]KHF24226.1 HupH hydrogenase expression protein [Solemya velum gill symbiont]OOY36040.1 hypothetical protein BOV88_00030 [Solemya velum gill symbiont]OOY36723.1 hypothetical protein BOV89_11045 [Solemya velum gill symbiont]OOY42101.1 hypothetical protein BOV91_08065 [Solemya velum gill symbiont]OOY48827.1 hypothetical protein BOV93_01710 [Solemya velum gill symbiont]